MNFVIPKKSTMNKLYRLVKKFYKLNTYEFFDGIGQRIFFITSNAFSFVVIISPEDNKLEIFHGEDGLITCHNLLSGDDRAIRNYGINSISVEEHDVEDTIYGKEFYEKKYKFFQSNGKNVVYYSSKFGQRPLMLNQEESLLVIDVLEKLLCIQKSLKKKGYNKYEEEMVYTFEFKNSKRKFSLSYELLETFNFIPNLTSDVEDDGRFAQKLSKLEVKPGVIHIGQIQGFSTYEIYDNLIEIEVGFCPIYFYGATEDGQVNHVIYSSPKEKITMISNAVCTMFFEKHGLYDTVITDNIYIYNNMYDSLSAVGVELIFDPSDSLNNFMTSFMIRMSQVSSDVNIVDEAINENKDELKMIILNSYDELDELNDQFFSKSLADEIVEEVVEDEEIEESDGLDEDSPSEYVS